MAANPNADRIARLTVYIEQLKSRLTGGVPEKHKHRPDVFKEMIERDIRKTKATLDKLRG